jgi:predicted phage terminase large subunit-like protein
MMNYPSLQVSLQRRHLPSQQEIRAEQARRGLLSFTTYTFPAYKADPVHRLIAATADRIVSGELRKVMFFAPPQHGKSELASVRLPAYWLGRRPDDPIIMSSYVATLAETHSRQARQTVESIEFSDVFPGVATHTESRAVDHWAMKPPYRGSMLAIGVGGAVTGHGGMLGIIDDPVENWAQAQSQTIRDNTWEWWRTTFRTRIWEGGSIVLIMTRWHEDDLAGRLLLEQAADWTVLRLPALAETQEERDDNNRRLGQPSGQPDPLGRAPGEPLAPERIRKDVGELAWAGQYQGVPRLAEGNTFKRDWLPIVAASPANARRVRYWDKAGTAGGDGARSAGVLIAVADGIYYVEDVVKGRWSSNDRNVIMRQTAELDAQKYDNAVSIWHEQEPGSGGKESAEMTNKNLAGFPVRGEPVTGSKDVRLQPFADQCQAGNVRLVRGAWNGEYIEELCAIPNGRFRDQSDASSGAFNKLARAQPQWKAHTL